MYELWDAETRNVIRFFQSAAEADDVLSSTVRKSGPAILDALLLLREDENEDNELIAEGQAILVAVKRLRSDELGPSTAPPVSGRRTG